MHKRKVQYEMEVFYTNKLNIICCSTERYTDALQGCSSTLISFKKSYSQLPPLRKEHKKTHKDNLCLFRALALHLHGNERLEEETSILFILFLSNKTNPDLSKFQGVFMDGIPSVEDLVGIKTFIYDIDLIDGAMVGDLARWSIKKYEKNVQLIQYTNHLIR